MVFQIVYQSNSFNMGKRVLIEKNTFHAQFFNKFKFSYIFLEKMGIFGENFWWLVADF